MSKLATKLSVLLLALPLAACGDDGGDGNTPPDIDAGIDAALVDGGDSTATCIDEASFFAEAALANTIDTDPGLGDPTNDITPDFAPGAGAPVLSGGGTPPAGGFFDQTAEFIGAIGEDDWTAGWTAFPTNVPGIDLDNLPAGAEDVEEDITEATTWSADTVYTLRGKIFVRAALTIEAGTIIRGDNGSALAVTTEGSIEAVGTAEEPIVFTSSKDSGAAAGDWGGLVLVGKAPINVSGGSDVVEGFESGEEEGNVTYGGDDAAFDCGSLSYVRIEYAGFELSPNNELNGLTVAGCGSDTELDFVQIHRGLDDGIEFFGGTANVKHLLVTLPDDDGLDCDYGWSGNGQFIIVQQNANTGDKAIECDNNGDDNSATPRTNPTLWNLTLIGSDSTSGDTQAGMHLRRGMSADINNAIVAYFRSFAVDIDSTISAQLAADGELSIKNSYFFKNNGGDHWPSGFDISENAENDCYDAE